MGEVFAGRYELVDVLDAGGMGTVWRVWDLREKTYRAAKMLRQSDSDSLLRFVRESATRVEHPHVVTPTGWSAEDDRVLFAMPLVGGGSVDTLVRDFGPLPPALVRTVTLQLLDALVAVHAAGIVHRDVKPANLLLEPTGTGTPYVRLSDFGIAATVGSPRLTRVAEIVHTPGYAAPEVGDGADPDPRQDLYAVGVVMQEMLTGRRPDAAVPAGPVTGDLAEVRARLVAPDPLARFSSAAEARAALGAAVVPEATGEPVEVFDHLPELPDGWGPGGPGTGSPGVRPVPPPPVPPPPVPPPPVATAAPVGRPREPLSPRARQRLLAGVLAVVGVALLLAALLAL